MNEETRNKPAHPLVRAGDFIYILFVLSIMPAAYLLQTLFAVLGVTDLRPRDAFHEVLAVESGVAVICLLVYGAIVILRIRDRARYRPP